ncbi:hypothetical protein CHS0354_017433, partial [Potamilus streckersoni]
MTIDNLTLLTRHKAINKDSKSKTNNKDQELHVTNTTSIAIEVRIWSKSTMKGVS